GAGGLAGRETARVQAPAGGGAPGGSGQGPASRGREEIEEVFDRNKGVLYALYNRALRENPALQGKVVLRLTIQPDGTVSACEIVSSDLGDAELERKLVERVKLFRFQTRDVAPVTTTKPLDFFPA
ncbi:MAG: AgmX/PglI C-terminal domain-containing protein, partial [Solimonas sp.]